MQAPEAARALDKIVLTDSAVSGVRLLETYRSDKRLTPKVGMTEKSWESFAISETWRRGNKKRLGHPEVGEAVTKS